MAKRGLSTPAYAYALNNPVRYFDPDGLGPKDKLYSLPKKFWKWYHKNEKKKGDRDLEKSEAEKLHEEWLEKGKPAQDAKCEPTPEPDPAKKATDILDLLWPLPPLIDPNFILNPPSDGFGPNIAAP